MDPKGRQREKVEDDDVVTETVVERVKVEVERRTPAREASDGESVESGVPVVRAKLG
jgi:hypothetical protein